MRDDPLVLFCSPRSGSSFIAGAFRNHGFWTGESFDGGGYESHESIPLRDFFKLHWKLDAGNHTQDATRADLRRFCTKLVPAGQVWMFKGLSEYYPVWRAHFPRMRAVMVYRERSQAIEAHVRRRGERVRQIATQVVTERYAFMDRRLIDDPLAWRVDADKIVSGDATQLDPILAEYGIERDNHLALKDIDSSMFHQ